MRWRWIGWAMWGLALWTLAACHARSAPGEPSTFPDGGSATVAGAPPARGRRAPVAPADEASAPEADASVSADLGPMPSPGLGTEFGEHRDSESFTTRFVRSGLRPEVTLAMWYDDWSGVGQAARTHGASPVQAVDTARGTFVVSLLDELGRPLPAADVGGRRYAIGQVGQRYQIAIENHSGERWEIVASVDGLDVIDGRTAALHKRGYVVDPWTTITIDGWRTSASSIAAFRFGELPDSYAARKGQPRNVGVIGVAFFRERGAARLSDDVHRRHSADPFPGRFAPPPPR